MGGEPLYIVWVPWWLPLALTACGVVGLLTGAWMIWYAILEPREEP